ncbi:hypothetical protein B0A52_00991 [Exophiala mesophila]|uniref:Transcription factor domain-containing protein n=1 Tax=Exophiala mesophila TaxID=212818 RepID=A0A438NIT9_EXOME|nr:hypothetical protein B0A52_00991 [Exophiala mesophila]
MSEQVAVLGSEREIEHVNDRLASLERILQRFVQEHPQQGQNPSPSSLAGPLGTPRDTQQDEGQHFEGDSSFTAHSKYITQAFETSLSNSPYSSTIRDVSSAVATLRGFFNENIEAVKDSSPEDKPLQEAVLYPQLSQLSLPPMDFVLRLLRHAKAYEHSFFYECTFLNLKEVTTLCQSLYFPAESYTIATFITVHVVLYYLCRDLDETALEQLHLSAAEARDIIDTCNLNVETAARSLRILMDPTYDNIQALTMASLQATEVSRSSAAWSLVSAACRMCQSAGYHRLRPYSIDPSRETSRKRAVFWPRWPEEMPGVWGLFYLRWIDLAQVQGDVYDELYCARAQMQPVQTRAKVAKELAARLLQSRKDFLIDAADAPNPQALQDGIRSVDIILLSTLTLVYRCVPPEPLPGNRPPHPLKPSQEALDAARDALTANNAAFEILKHRPADQWRLFIHYTLVWCPFVPFLVVFSNAIAERSRDDLELLEKVVATLQGASIRSVGVDKLQKACKTFTEIARIYLDQTETAVQQRFQQEPQVTSTTSTTTTNNPQLNHTTEPVNPAIPSLSQPDMTMFDTLLPDLPLSQQAFDGLFDGWDLGVANDNAREISSYFEYLTGAGNGGAFPGAQQQGFYN